MRSAYSGSAGYNQDSDRLSNIRRSIDSIEQRLMGATAPAPGYGHSPMAPQQQGYPNVAAHAPQAPHYHQAPPGYAADPAASEIARRQQMLNSNAASLAEREGVAHGAAAASMGGIGRQLEELKRELAGVRSQVSKPIAVQQSVPQQDIDRIAKSLSELQTQLQPEDGTFDRLSKELEQLRSAMKGDVRSALQKGMQTKVESQAAGLTKRLDELGKDVRSAIRSEFRDKDSAQNDELVRRLDELSSGVDQISVQSANAVAPRVDNLSAQLDALRMTIDDLPQTLAISRIEDRLAELTDKVGGLESSGASSPAAGNVSRVTPEEFVSIEKRLDEIARALVAVSNTGRNAPKMDMSAVERVEARMTELARTLDTVAQQGDNANLEKLAVRIEGLTERLGSFEKYAESGDLGGASALFAAPDTGVIEDQLRLLTSRIDEVASQPGTGTLEDQIEKLSRQVEEASNVHSTSAQMSNLEAQIGLILRQMDSFGGSGSVDFTPVEARLGQIEHQLQANQNFSLEAAQQAAQHAVAMMGPQSEAGNVIEALAHDLKSLQLIAEGNAAQSNQSVQQVHQTMQQVVDRLNTIESTLDGEAVRHATMVPTHELAMPPAATLADQAHLAAQQNSADPVYASDGLMNAAIADENLGVIHQAAVDVGFVEPNQQTTEHSGELSPENHAPSAADNMPLEPGSAAPNIDELVQRASAQLNETHARLAASEDNAAQPVADISMPPAAVLGGDDRAADEMRPDAVAAARRALQATTAEMTAVRNETGDELSENLPAAGRKKGLKSGSKFDTSKLRKPLVLGAAALLLAIVTFKSIGMFTGSDRGPIAKLDNPAVEMSATNPDQTLDQQSRPLAQREDGDKTVRTIGTADPAPTGSETDVDGGNATVAVAVPQATPSTPAGDEPTSNTVPVNVPGVPDQSAATVSAESTAIVAAPVVDTPTDVAKIEPPAPAKSVFDVSPESGPAALVAAASVGDPKALFQLGMRYSEGDNVQRNMTESAKWFLRSAESGFAPAQYSIGSLYEKGIGVERDIGQASTWYEKAAAQGNARAMHNLAVIYAMGNPPTVQPNMDTAVEWFKKAAQFGIKDSQFNLGILYGQGMGVPQNLVDSYKWFALAAKTGDTDANKKRDEVANAMDAADLDFARKEVNNWAPSKLIEAVNRVAVPEEWRGGPANSKSATNKNAQNTNVKLAQDLLNQRGFNVGEPDGLIGPKTKRAIMEFQRSAGIPITGKVDKKLLQALDVRT